MQSHNGNHNTNMDKKNYFLRCWCHEQFPLLTLHAITFPDINVDNKHLVIESINFLIFWHLIKNFKISEGILYGKCMLHTENQKKHHFFRTLLTEIQWTNINHLWKPISYKLLAIIKLLIKHKKKPRGWLCPELENVVKSQSAYKNHRSGSLYTMHERQVFLNIQ